MNFTFSIYYTPLILAVILSSVVMIYSLRYRKEPHGRAFFILSLAGVWWAFFNILEYGFNSLPLKIFWANVEYLGIETVMVGWLAVIANFTGQTKWVTRRSLLILAIIPVITILLVWTNPLHGLMRSNITLDTNGPYSIIKKNLWALVLGYHGLQQSGNGHQFRHVASTPDSSP